MNEFCSKVFRGDVRASARLMRLVDDRAEGYEEYMKEVWKHTGHAHIIGITGAPGAGKSTMTDKLIAKYRSMGKTVGVVAIDPTSPFSGGAILGDRIRMADHATDEGVFIRSVGTRGHLGGLSVSTMDIVAVMDAMGKDIVIIETVGVGQDEVEIAMVADTCIVVTVPGLGDDIQAIKAGIFEIADIFIVNKADREGVERTVKDYSNNQALILVGAADTLTRITLPENTHYFCIRFAPGVFYWNQRTLPAELFKKILYCENSKDYSPIMPKNLARFESIEKRTAYWMDNVLPCLKKTYLTPTVVQMIHDIVETFGSIRIEELSEKLSYSVRHTNRLFLNALGYGPKTFCKYVRIQNVLSEIKKMPGLGSKSFLQKVCYSDQAHFQREFKEFTGITPRQYIQLLR